MTISVIKTAINMGPALVHCDFLSGFTLLFVITSRGTQLNV